MQHKKGLINERMTESRESTSAFPEFGRTDFRNEIMPVWAVANEELEMTCRKNKDYPES